MSGAINRLTPATDAKAVRSTGGNITLTFIANSPGRDESARANQRHANQINTKVDRLVLKAMVIDPQSQDARIQLLIRVVNSAESGGIAALPTR
jgi:hypothetical protein